MDAIGTVKGCSDADGEHRYGNGICDRFTPGGADCHRSCSFCFYSCDKSGRIHAEQEDDS